MDQYIDQIGMFIEANQVWAGPITFLLTLGESLVLVGLFIPATALMLLTGGLIGAGTLDPWNVLAWGVAGAIVGDALSYGLGRWAGPGVLRRWPLKQQRTAVARARLFFYRYGFASVLIGRFLGPIRSTIPTVAGVMGMAHGRFQLANVLRHPVDAADAGAGVCHRAQPGLGGKRATDRHVDRRRLFGAAGRRAAGRHAAQKGGPAAPKRDAPLSRDALRTGAWTPEALARFSLDGAPLRTGEADPRGPALGELRCAGRLRLRGWHIVLE